MGVLLALAIAGCGDAGSSRTSAQPVPTATPIDANRVACHELSGIDGAGKNLNPVYTRPTAMLGLDAKYPRIVEAAGKVLEATADVEATDDPRGDPNIALMTAVIEMADACGDLYGDGPW